MGRGEPKPQGGGQGQLPWDHREPGQCPSPLFSSPQGPLGQKGSKGSPVSAGEGWGWVGGQLLMCSQGRTWGPSQGAKCRGAESTSFSGCSGSPR